ncbi:hypothetical protein [Micromonospora sp. LH3U1]|uniref:hypothetical protein n=1 Tax=Micromonospora sp. LH3U1 TaxID=3018339 RepID=UPI00234A7064|nr:hypothetical protein [Micromonospora sp. LH3U1]WCN83341.1 hypothetical protein PCA76_09915 [Micromonospora sp. LH3U1]
MVLPPPRLAAAYFDAIEILCRVTPKGWYAERGTARAAVRDGIAAGADAGGGEGP